MQNSPSFYQESNQFNPRGLAIACVASLIVSLFLGYFYTILTLLIPLVYANFFITVGLGFAMAMASKYLIRLGHIRHFNSKLALGILAGLFANYFQWAAYITYAFQGHFPSFGDYLSNIGWVFSPKLFFLVISEINKSGLWSMFGMQINGFVLTAIWFIEFLIILAVPVLLVLQAKSYPYSEKLGKWYKKYTLFDDFEPISAVHLLIENLQKDAVAVIQSLQPGSGWRHSKIHLLYLEEEDKQYLTIEKIYVENRGTGKKTMRLWLII